MKKKPIGKVLCCFFEILCSSFTGSRASIFKIILFLYLLLPTIDKKKRKKIYRLMFFLFPLSVVAFIFATSVIRGENYSILEYIKLIIGRLSLLDPAAISLGGKLGGGWNSEVFISKYSFLNQMKLVTNTIIPGDIFPYDIHPNLYFRAVYFGNTLEWCNQYYSSMNMTLPVYFCVKYGYIPSVVITVALLVIIYKLIRRTKSYNLSYSLLFIFIYQLLYYFDWVYTFNYLYGILLTLMMLFCWSKITQANKKQISYDLNMNTRNMTIKHKIKKATVI